MPLRPPTSDLRLLLYFESRSLLTVEQREFARANLAHFKALHSVTFVKELPKTATGKIQKYVLRAKRTAIAPQ